MHQYNSGVLNTYAINDIVTVQMPQDEFLLVDWKHQLKRDVDTLKAQENLLHDSHYLTIIWNVMPPFYE